MTPPRTVVATAAAPGALGAYSQAIRCGGRLYCSGQIGIDPASGKLVGDSVKHQTAQALLNLTAVCEAAGTELSAALRTTIYTTRMDRFTAINGVYEEFFAHAPPARVTIGVARLPFDAQIEIDAIVWVPADD